LLITRGAGEGDPAAVAIEGLKGMFLDAALEYDSVLFRSVALDSDTDLETGLQHALSLSHSLAEIRFHGQEAFTNEGYVQPLSLIDPPDFALNPGEVVVISGGGKGITPHLAYALAPQKPRLVLLGSSALDPTVDYDSPVAPMAAAQLASGREITQTLKELARQGLEATYYSCDVNDPENVAAVLGRVVSEHGGIAGIIQGRHYPGLLYGVYDRRRFFPGGGSKTPGRLEPVSRRPGARLALHGHALFHYRGQGQRRPD
jgi:hypothetical protein